MGDDLNRSAQVVAAPLLVEYRPIDLARSDIVVDGQAFVNKALIVPQIEVGFRAIVRDEHLAVLIRAHRARVDIDVRVEFLYRNLIAARLQQTPQGSCSDSFAQTGHNAAGDKNIFRHSLRSSISI